MDNPFVWSHYSTNSRSRWRSRIAYQTTLLAGGCRRNSSMTNCKPHCKSYSRWTISSSRWWREGAMWGRGNTLPTPHYTPTVGTSALPDSSTVLPCSPCMTLGTKQLRSYRQHRRWRHRYGSHPRRRVLTLLCTRSIWCRRADCRVRARSGQSRSTGGCSRGGSSSRRRASGLRRCCSGGQSSRRWTAEYRLPSRCTESMSWLLQRMSACAEHPSRPAARPENRASYI